VIKTKNTFLSKLTSIIRKHNLLKPDDTVIVAISGGADSTALLDLLTRLPGFSLKLISAHLNHCLRGEESDRDQEFCRELTTRYSIPFEFQRTDVKKLVAENGLNLEDAGRQARMSFLDQLSEKYNANAVALAHHADDQAETLLIRLLRGSGMTGLSGMEYRNSRGYIRPLLETTRLEIELYLHEQGLNWREDSSNHDTTFLRNRIRHELLPHLEQYNPGIRPRLAATALLLGGDEEFLAELTEQAFKDIFRAEKDNFACDIGQFTALNLALQRRVLRHAFREMAGNRDGLSQHHIDAILALLDSNRPNTQFSLPQHITVVREYGRLLFKRSQTVNPDTLPDVKINTSGHYPLPAGGSLTIELINHPIDPMPRSTDIIYIDFSKTPFPWQVRTFRSGDRMIPSGMHGRKKVKDIFIDRKIPLAERKSTPLLFCGDLLIWLVGVCSSEICRVSEENSSIARVSYLND
jgi:tRNA(Ile)-lysidine synthase